MLLLLFWLGTRRMKIVPGRGQSILEFAVGFVRDNIVYGALGEKDGKRFLPLLTAMFFFIVGMNITGIIPGINLAGSSVVGLPLVLAIVSYVAFMYAGIKKHPGAFFKNSLFPPNVPWYLYLIVTPIEFLSTFILILRKLCAQSRISPGDGRRAAIAVSRQTVDGFSRC